MNQRGSILLASVLALLLVSSIGLVVLTATASLDGPARRRHDRLHVFYLAQSGLERAVGEVFTAPTLPDWSLAPAVPVPETTFGPGSYRVVASVLEPDRAVLDVVGTTAADSLHLTVTLERGAGGEILVTGWDEPGPWGWTP